MSWMQPRTCRASMLQSLCWSQGCWWQGLSQAVVWALLGSGSCLQVLSQALLSSSFDFRGKWCTIMAANICFTKISPRSEFSPWCAIVKGGFSCSSSARADEQTNYTHLPCPGRCWSQCRRRVCRAIWILALTQLVRIATTLGRRWPCDTAGLQSPLCRACHTCGTGEHVFTHVLVSLASLKQTKALSQPLQLHLHRPHTRAASQIYKL